MADVDQCTRYAEAGLCGDARSNALKISKIDNGFRNTIFRGKSVSDIEKMLVKFSSTIKKSVSEKFGFRCDELFASSNNNRDSADLFCLTPGGERVNIEVKFGAYTDKAAGMGNFAKIFGTDIFTIALSTSVRKQWERLVISEYPSMTAQSKRLVETLNSAVNDFNKYLDSINYTLPKHEQLYMEDYLINNSGSFESRSNKYTRFETNKQGTKIVEIAPLKKGVGEWRVVKVDPIDISDDKPRVNVFVINEASRLKIKFTLNNKNDFHLKGIPGAKVRSKYMLNCPSWNVWIYQI